LVRVIGGRPPICVGAGTLTQVRAIRRHRKMRGEVVAHDSGRSQSGRSSSSLPRRHEPYTQATALWQILARIGDEVLAGFEQRHAAVTEFDTRALRFLSSRGDDERDPAPAACNRGLAAEVLAALPREVLATNSMERGPCPICLDGYAPGDEIVRMPCAHTAHWRCGAKWYLAQGLVRRAASR